METRAELPMWRSWREEKSTNNGEESGIPENGTSLTTVKAYRPSWREEMAGERGNTTDSWKERSAMRTVVSSGMGTAKIGEDMHWNASFPKERDCR